MKYYNDKKYYVRRAIRIAKKCDNQELLKVLKLIHRHDNVISIDYAKTVNEIYENKIDLFNIEGDKNGVLQ